MPDSTEKVVTVRLPEDLWQAAKERLPKAKESFQSLLEGYLRTWVQGGKQPAATSPGPTLVASSPKAKLLKKLETALDDPHVLGVIDALLDPKYDRQTAPAPSQQAHKRGARP